MNEKLTKKYAYVVMLVSVSIVALNLGLIADDAVKIPIVGIKLPVVFLWVSFVFLLIPYTNELRNNKVEPNKLFLKQLNSELCTWSRKMKGIDEPDLYTPLIKVSKVDKIGFVWSCLYHQAGSNPEPSYVAISSFFNTLRLSLISIFKVFFSFKMLDLITLPILLMLSALITKVFTI